MNTPGKPSSELDDHTVSQVAHRLLQDYDARTSGQVFAEGLRLSLPDARRVQDAVAKLREMRGESVVGYKIGNVSPINQQRNGIPHPIWGRIWSSEQFPNGVRLSKSQFDHLAIEAEFAVVLGCDLNSPAHSPQDLVDAVERIVPVIELHNLIFRGPQPVGPELVANNTIHCGVVRGVGMPRPTGSLQTSLSMFLDHQLLDFWDCIDWPNSFLPSLIWLNNELRAGGIRLKRGQWILTGAIGPPIPVEIVGRADIRSTAFGDVCALFGTL